MKKLLSSLLLLSLSTMAINFTFDGRVQWAKYLAELGFIQKKANDADYNATSYITRAELTAIALKFAWEKVPEPYTCKKYFVDVTNNDWICAAVEKAADIGLINRINKNFYPQNQITRPEAIAIVLKSSGLDKKIPANISSFEDPEVAFVPNGWDIQTWLKKRATGYNPSTKIVLVDILDWRFSTFQKALYAGIIDVSFTMPENGRHKENYQKYKSYYNNNQIYSFWEDFFIFRGDAFIIFGEAYKKMQLMSGEATI